jgi:ribonuclease VapC
MAMRAPDIAHSKPSPNPIPNLGPDSGPHSHPAKHPVVFDSSAILAVLLSEPGADNVLPVLEGGYLSTVSLIEVHARMISLGAEAGLAWERVLDFQCQIVPLSEAQARVAAELFAPTRPFGLSLGDRVCLALAMELQARVLTADRIWERVAKSLFPGMQVEVIR